MTKRRKRSSGFAGIPVHEPFIIVERHPQVVTAICLTVLAVIAICAALLRRARLRPPARDRARLRRRARARVQLLRMVQDTARDRRALRAHICRGNGLRRLCAYRPTRSPLGRERARSARQGRAPVQETARAVQADPGLLHEVDNIQIMPPSTPTPRSVVVQGPSLTQSLLASRRR